jgi:hypothetical protein
MAGDFIEFFNELLLGSGAWFGLIIACAILLVIASINKFGGIVAMPVAILLSFEYMDHDLGWNAVIMFFCGIVVLIGSIYSLNKGEKR